MSQRDLTLAAQEVRTAEDIMIKVRSGGYLEDAKAAMFLKAQTHLAFAADYRMRHLTEIMTVLASNFHQRGW